jgi:hypothetical protein
MAEETIMELESVLEDIARRLDAAPEVRSWKQTA